MPYTLSFVNIFKKIKVPWNKQAKCPLNRNHNIKQQNSKLELKIQIEKKETDHLPWDSLALLTLRSAEQQSIKGAEG